MRRIPACVRLILPFAFLSASAAAPAPEYSAVAGVWRGESSCVSKDPACHNETVVYYIKEVPDHPDVVEIQADKIVDGKPVTMGTGEWLYDRERHTLVWQTPRQAWRLEVDGDRIAGTLTLFDGTLFRKLTLRKDR